MVEKFCGGLTAEGLLLLYLTELEKLLIGLLTGELLQFRHSFDIATLHAAVVAGTTDFLNDTSTLDTLLKTTNDIRATLVVVTFDLDVYCHMWARAYHIQSSRASDGLWSLSLGSYWVRVAFQFLDHLIDWNLLLTSFNEVAEYHGLLHVLFLANDDGIADTSSLCFTELS